MDKCSRCSKKIGFLTMLVHYDKELCFDCIDYMRFIENCTNLDK